MTYTMPKPLSAQEIEDIGQFAWPGGYETYFMNPDGSTLCQPCALKDAQEDFPFGHIYFAGSEADTDWFTSCDQCNKVIIEDWEDVA